MLLQDLFSGVSLTDGIQGAGLWGLCELFIGIIIDSSVLIISSDILQIVMYNCSYL